MNGSFFAVKESMLGHSPILGEELIHDTFSRRTATVPAGSGRQYSPDGSMVLPDRVGNPGDARVEHVWDWSCLDAGSTKRAIRRCDASWRRIKMVRCRL
jgi:hypothetical protein